MSMNLRKNPSFSLAANSRSIDSRYFGFGRHLSVASFGKVLLSGSQNMNGLWVDLTFKHHYKKATKIPCPISTRSKINFFFFCFEYKIQINHSLTFIFCLFVQGKFYTKSIFIVIKPLGKSCARFSSRHQCRNTLEVFTSGSLLTTAKLHCYFFHGHNFYF